MVRFPWGYLKRIEIMGKDKYYLIYFAGIKTSDIAIKMGTSSLTVKRIVEKLINQKFIERHGIGPGSYYNLL